MGPLMNRRAHAVVLAAARSGTPSPLVAGLTPAERTRRGIAAANLDAVPMSDPNGVVLFLAADALAEPAALTALVAGAAGGSTVFAAGDDPDAPAALAVSVTDAVAHRIVATDQLAGLAATFRAEGRLQQVAVGDALCLRVADEATARRASNVLLRRLVRPTDGFFARYFDRHLSRPISVHLVQSGVSPNTVSAIATLVGLVGAALLASMNHAARVLGATLFVVSTILDGCDGEVARLAFRCTDFGRRLDLIGDNVVNAAVFLALGIALSQGADGGVPAGVPAVTGVGFVMATLVGFLFSNWLARSKREISRDWYERLTGRDFAYVILVLAVIGHLGWFLWMAAVGCYVFTALVLIYWFWSARS
jgi:phosphatidylglycerophosphate synthase